MKKVKGLGMIVFVMLMNMGMSLQAQEHGPVIGGSYGAFYEKEGLSSSNLEGLKPHFHVGYSYRQHFNHKWALDATALYGMQGTTYQWYTQGSPSIKIKGNYVSLGAVASYECFKNFRVGVGAEFAWYTDKITGIEENTIKHPVDVPLVGRISYSLKYVEFQLAYKQGTCNLAKSRTLEGLKSRDIQLSVFVPLFGTNK